MSRGQCIAAGAFAAYLALCALLPLLLVLLAGIPAELAVAACTYAFTCLAVVLVALLPWAVSTINRGSINAELSDTDG